MQHCAPPAIKAAIEQGERQGHSVHVAIVLHDEHPVYVCTLCGAYGEYAPRKLAEPCRRKPNRGAQDKLRRIAKHVHPHTKALLGPIWRVTHVPAPAAITRGHGAASTCDGGPCPRRALDSLAAAEDYDDEFEEWVRQQAEDADTPRHNLSDPDADGGIAWPPVSS